MRSLPLLDERIEARARATAAAHPFWPCREGCDDCCRSLARVPEITEPEWSRLRDAIASLPEDQRRVVLDRMRGLSASDVKVTCPMLDRGRGACLVYDARPVACRTYGFYAERDGGLHCAKVSAAVASHETEASPVVWGNGESIADELRTLGEARSIVEWAGPLLERST